jgi:ribonuclease HI
VVKQLTGQYRIKNRELQELFWQLKEKEKKLKKVSYCWVPRENKFIQLADQLVNQCLDEKTR